jgi:hypothetical protein
MRAASAVLEPLGLNESRLGERIQKYSSVTLGLKEMQWISGRPEGNLLFSTGKSSQKSGEAAGPVLLDVSSPVGDNPGKVGSELPDGGKDGIENPTLGKTGAAR